MPLNLLELKKTGNKRDYMLTEEGKNKRKN